MLRWTALLRSYISLEQVSNIVQAKVAGHPTVAHVQLVDVRSTAEVAKTGLIPTAINIPLSILPDVLADGDGDADVTEEEFADTFGAARPVKGASQLVFYCAHGVRSAIAVEVAEELGYHGALNFSGSWAQWSFTFGKEEGATAEASASMGEGGLPSLPNRIE